MSDNRKVTLQHILVVWIVPSPLYRRVIIASRMSLAVPIPRWKTGSPSIFDRHEVTRRLLLAWEHRRGARITQRRQSGRLQIRHNLRHMFVCFRQQTSLQVWSRNDNGFDIRVNSWCRSDSIRRLNCRKNHLAVNGRMLQCKAKQSAKYQRFFQTLHGQLLE